MTEMTTSAVELIISGPSWSMWEMPFGSLRISSRRPGSSARWGGAGDLCDLERFGAPGTLEVWLRHRAGWPSEARPIGPDESRSAPVACFSNEKRALILDQHFD